MSLLKRSPQLPADARGVVGSVRLERDNDRLSKKVGAGDVAVIDHVDLDRAHAELLVERGVSAVVNVSASTSGRFPNSGPQVLASAGILLVDHVGPSVWTKLKNGDRVRIEDGKIFRDEIFVCGGTELDAARIADLRGSAATGLTTQLESLAANATDHLQRERALLIEGAGVPRIGRRLRGRPVVVVSRSGSAREDLRGLKAFISSYDPVLVGAGAGADVLIDAGYTPDVVAGQVDDLSDKALTSGAEVVVVVSTEQPHGRDRLERAGVEVQLFRTVGSDEDAALILADANDATLLVLAGGHDGLLQLLERGSSEAASTFVTRLRLSGTFVDARAVGAFYRARTSVWPVLLLVLVGVAAVVAAIASTPVGNDWFADFGDHLSDAGDWVRGLWS